MEIVFFIKMWFLCWIVSMAMFNAANKLEFGKVTVGDLIFTGFLSFLGPFSAIASFIVLLVTFTSCSGYMNKKVF